jgi:transcriptional regulator with XRE-family HTH domain
VSEYYALIGSRLRQAREEAHLSRRQVVEEMKRRGYRLSVSSLQDFEEGRRLNLQALIQLAEVLNRHPAMLLGFELSSDLDAEQVQYLVERSRALSSFEKEFFYAAANHVQRLRREGFRPAKEPVPVEPSPPAVRREVKAHLARGGAFAAKELLMLPEFAQIPETLLQRELMALREEGVVEVVATRPIRYALRRAASDDEGGVERELG